MAAEVPKLTQVAISYDKQCWAMSGIICIYLMLRRKQDEEGNVINLV